MTLQPGTRLGPYEVQAAVGAGGMGEVYRARDTRLGRDVAIKVLPESFARDADRLRRFEQEARTVAALNHPNILAVYDTGEHQGAPYMVCELLDGQTLRAEMQEGAMGQRRAVEYASQIAEGLAAAHDQGAVHRDLKPENVFITKNGRVKILDFGLAKLARAKAAAAGDGVTAGSMSVTTPGVLLGTAGYMSPEQVRGKEVDARTDIFAFGAVLYEMLSGQRAFKGETSVETMNAILKEDPPELETEKLKVSPGLERLVRRCLEKEPARRFQSARDVGFALEAISGTSVGSDLKTPALPPKRRRWVGAVAVVLVVAAAAMLAYMAGRRQVSSSQAAYEQLTFEPGYAGPARFTRDGNTVVYSAAWNGGARQLYWRRNNSSQATPLNIDADVLGLADNGDMAVILKRRFLATWLQRGTLARLPLEGGTPRPILEDVYDADISRDGKEFAVVRSDRGKQRLEFPVGKVLFETAGWISDVRISPDGMHVAFIDHPLLPDDRGGVALVDRQGSVRRLTPYYSTGRSLCWTPDGKEIWYTASLQGEDPGMYGVTPAGQIRTVLRSPTELVIEDISGSGRVLLESVRFQIEMGLKRSDEKSARDLETSVDLGALSPSGEWVVFNHYQGNDYQVFLKNTNGAAAVKLGDGYGCGITADGRTVSALRTTEPHKLYLYPTGTGDQKVIELGELTAAFGTNENDVTFARDGRWAAFSAFDAKHEVRDYLLDLRDGKFRPVTPPGSKAGKLSPDGTRIVTLDVAAQKYVLVDVASGKMSDVPGIEKQDEVLGWGTDGRMLAVWNQELPARLSLVDVASGRRQLVQTVEPLATLGSMYARMVTSADAKTAVYRHRRGLYAIYIADGLK
ncbi:MAG: protein kinase [Acidobacteriia bacterium]|nr:protein kinase [Terriglobia bacterium]